MFSNAIHTIITSPTNSLSHDFALHIILRVRSLPACFCAQELYKPPTAAELREFRQGDDLFKSNLFRLQLTELLTEVRVKDAKTAQVDAGLHALKKALTGLASATEAVEVDRTTVFKGGVKPPLAVTPEAATLIRYQFVKPSKVAVVGSYLLKVSTVSGVGAHVCVCAFSSRLDRGRCICWLAERLSLSRH
jgi:U3 small nucleolar RNA-associated protein 22